MRVTKRYRVIIILAVLIFLFSLIKFLKFVRKATHPNILLITIDALRADHLGCYGYKRNTSPNIDNLAEEGLIFTQAISQSSYTPPSITSLLTSTYPYTHGVYNFGISMNHRLKILPGALKDKGYYLGLISGRGGLSEFRFPEIEKIFDTFYPSNHRYILASEVTKNAIKWLRLNKGKKFFLWLYYLDPHTPYRPPSPYDKLYLGDKLTEVNNKNIPIAEESKELYDGYGVIPRVTAVKGITDVNYYISQYDGEIRYTDEQIGMVLAELKRLNLFDRTLIIITSDHGESMGEHNFYFVHSNNLYDELLKVPLIIRYKGIRENGRIDKQVQLVDIMPTILDIAKIRIPKQAEGVSLLPLVKRSRYNVRYAFSAVIHKKGAEKSLRTERWKLIYKVEQNKYELYNFKKDPKELINLIDIEKEIAAFLKNKLHNLLKETQSKITTQNQVIDDMTKEKLKSLGYDQ